MQHARALRHQRNQMIQEHVAATSQAAAAMLGRLCRTRLLRHSSMQRLTSPSWASPSGTDSSSGTSSACSPSIR